MDKYAPLVGGLLLFGSVMAMACFAGWKDRRFLEGKEPKPMPEWKLCLMTIVLVVVVGIVVRFLI